MGNFRFLGLALLFPFLIFAKVYVVVEGIEYKPELKPFIERELKKIEKNWGNYEKLTLKELKSRNLNENDVVVILGEYYGWKVKFRGKPKWLILDYCDSCSSISLKDIKADFILCSDSSIPAYGFEKIYEIPLKELNVKNIIEKLRENFKENDYKGELGKLKIKLIKLK
jgi:hypothetical protein